MFLKWEGVRFGWRGCVWAKLNVVDNRWVRSGASLCVKPRKLTGGGGGGE